MSEKQKTEPSAFKLVSERRAWWPVIFSAVTEEGDVIEQRFEMRFIIHGQDEFLAIVEEGHVIARAASRLANGQNAVDAPAPTFSGMAAGLVVQIATDWRGVHAENGEPLKWEEQIVRQLMNVPNIFGAVMDAYKACRAAKKELREGN